MKAEDVQDEIANVCNEIRDLLITKNKAYGNSALDPKRIFSTASAKEQIAVRIDDKLSRIKTLTHDPTIDQNDESLRDTKTDLIGYLVLELVCDRVNDNV